MPETRRASRMESTSTSPLSDSCRAVSCAAEAVAAAAVVMAAAAVMAAVVELATLDRPSSKTLNATKNKTRRREASSFSLSKPLLERCECGLQMYGDAVLPCLEGDHLLEGFVRN